MSFFQKIKNFFSAESEKENFNPSKNTQEKSVQQSTYFPDSYAAPYNPDELWQKQTGYTLYDECLKDETVNSLFEYKINLILGGGYYVDSDDENVRTFWDKILNEYYEGSFQQTLRKILTCLVYGFSVSEPVFKPVIVDGKQSWGLKFIKVRPPHGFEFFTDDFGNITKIVQRGAGVGQAIDLNNDDLLIFTYRPKFENPYGQPDLTMGVYRAVFAKKNIYKFMLIGLERFAMPTVVGIRPSVESDTRSADNFYDALKNLSAKAVVTMTKDYDVRYLESGKSVSGTYTEALNFLNLSIARAMLVPDLVGLSGEQMSSGGLGGNLGGVQFATMLEVFKRIRKDLLSVINQKIIYPLTKYNFGSDTYAELKFEDLTNEEKYKSAQMFLTYLEKGQVATDDQRNWFLSIIGAPIGEELERQDDDDPTPAESPQSEEKETENEDELIPPEQEDEQKKEVPSEPSAEQLNAADDLVAPTKDPWQIKSDKPYRELTLSEQRVNFAEVNDETQRLVKDNTETLNSAVVSMLQKLFRYIAEKKIVENKKFSLLNQLSLSGFGDIRKALDQLLTDSYKTGRMLASSEAKKKFAALPVAAQLAAQEVIDQWKRSRILTLTKGINDRVLNTVQTILSDAILKGHGTKEAVKEIDDSIEGYYGKARIETIVRTNVMSAFNQGRLQAMGGVDDVIGMQWSAIMDERTSDICAALDGKIFKPNEISDYPMPAHPNCRSIWVPVFGEEVEGKKEKEIFETKPQVEYKNGFINLV